MSTALCEDKAMMEDDYSPPEREPSATEWQAFEEHVASLYRRYEDASVQRSHHIQGRFSKVKRQVDVWVEDRAAGHLMTLAVECKAYKVEKVGIAVIDAFCGFLEDVGAHAGALYTSSRFTSGARARAHGHGHVLLFDHEQVPTVEEQDEALRFDWCPNCTWGEVDYSECEGGSYGYCGRCGAGYLKCENCGETVDFDHGRLECFGCGAAWEVSWHPKEMETITQIGHGQ